MSEFITIVIRTPIDPDEKAILHKAIEAIRPYQTCMSLEDEATILDMIENHPDFDTNIAEDARKQTALLHATARSLENRA